MTWIDTLIVALYLTITVILGVLVGRGQRDLDDYLLAGRRMTWWALLGSIVATETSTVTFLSIPGMAYASGGDLRFLQLATGFVIGRLVVAALLIPLYFAGRLRSAYEVLVEKLGTPTKHLAALVFLVTRNVSDGLRLYLTGLLWTVVIGWPLEITLLLVAGITVLYTFLGGLKSVVWNDCVQLLIYLAGAILALALACQGLSGGIDQLLEFAYREGKLRVFHWQWDGTNSYTIWAGLVGGAFLSLATHGADQMMVQRYLSARSRSDATLSVLLSGVVVWLQFALFLGLGIALAAYFAVHPPSPPIARADAAFPTFMAVAVPVGIKGILVAAGLAAAMSTLSSSLSASSVTIIIDLLTPLRILPAHASQAVQLRCSRWSTLVCAGFQVLVAWIAASLTQHTIDSVLAVAGFATSILLGLFLLALRSVRLDPRSAPIGLTLAVGTMTAIVFGTRIAWAWYGLFGALLTVTFSLTADWILRHLVPYRLR